MKRILAGFLTLAMVLNIAPVGALAASDSDAASIQAVAETEESPSSALDEETARAIASDPFLQGADSAPAEQQQQAEVDTSDVSMTATNSFGQLLVNGMEAQNSTSEGYTDRVTNVTMNGHTANVEFVLDGTADLVVAIYTDSDAEEMVASGTVTVTGSGNETAQVAISGVIPETYTVKAFLLDTTEHAPLSAVYTDVSHTQVMVDLDKATIDDFPADRVINLDGQTDTNFGALKEDVARVKSDGNANVLVSADDTAKVYTFEYATKSLEKLQQGDILYYEKDDDGLIIVKVEQIRIEGSTVTIQGSHDLEVTEVFEALKIDADMKTDDFEVRGTATDATYLGEYAMDTSAFATDSELDLSELAQTNESGEYPIEEKSKKFSIESKEKVDGLDEGSEVTAKVSGELNLSVKGLFEYNVANGQQYAHFEVSPKATMKAEIKGEVKTTIEIPSLDACPITGVFIGLDPKINFDAKVVMTLTASADVTLGFEYNKMGSAEGTFQNLCTEPIFKIIPTAEGQTYIGFDFGPSVAALGVGDWYVIRAQLTTEIGLRATLKAKSSGLESGHAEKVRHGCGLCYEGSMDLMIKVEASLTFLEDEDLKIGPKNLVDKAIPIATAYASPVYGDFGWGKCPHDKYRVHITVETQKNPTDVAIYMYTGGIGEGKEVATFQLASKTEQTYTGEAYFYLDPGSYTFKTTVGNKLYTSKPVLIGTMAVDIELEEDFVGPVKPDPDPDPGPEPDPDYELSLLNLTIYHQNILMDYPSAEDTPWYDDRDMVDQIELKEGVTTIGTFSFAQTAVRSVQMRSKVTDIGESAFAGCEKLEHVTFPGTMEEWKQVNIAEGNDALKKATIHCTDGDIKGNSGEEPGDEGKVVASGNCGENGDNVQWKLYENGHLIISGNGAMKNYENYKEIPWYAQKDEIKSVTIQQGVTSVGNYAFCGCSSLTSITLPESLTSIECRAFYGCSSLTSVTLPESLTSIGYQAFYGCRSLTSITIPENVTSIERYTFSGCRSLTSITLPESLTSIGGGAFYDCRSLTSITLPESLTSIGDDAFSDCRGLTSITLPESLTSIGGGAFSDCRGLTSITIPENVTSIGNDAFSYCISLTSITLPESLTSIGSDAFWACSGLTSITLPESLTSIGDGAFSDCGLTSITIPEKVTSIKGTAFFGCSSLTSITIPENVTSIGECAFYYCDRLKNVTYRGTMAQWKAISIGSDNYPLFSATIYCTDGDIVPGAENSISTGTATPTTGSKLAATFSGVEAGREYVVIVSRSSSEPLNADKLLYINQITAQADGELAVPFVMEADASEVKYTVACTRDDAEPDQPVDPGKPDDKPSSGGGDGGSMAIVLVGGVVLVAAVAGVVLMMPVDVQGTVKLADQPVANATVQVLQGDSVAAQTTTNADGWFAVKVRRGSYTLRVLWTDAEGNPVTRTQDFKAPDTSLNIAA